MTQPDSARLAAEVAESATRSFGSVAELVQRRSQETDRSMAAASAAVESCRQLAAAAATADPADQPRLAAEATKAAADALKSSYEAISAGCAAPLPAESKDEWKECRATIDRFDKLLVDLRKTGFGVVTALVGAATYLFKESQAGVKTSMLCMLILLIVTLYMIDRVHQVWLGVTVNRARELERQIGFTLTTSISNVFKGRDAAVLGFVLYFVLLFATCAMFWSAIPIAQEKITGGHRITMMVAGAAGMLAMIALEFTGRVFASLAVLRKNWIVVLVVVFLAVFVWLIYG